MDAPALLRRAATRAVSGVPFGAVASGLAKVGAAAEARTRPDDPASAATGELLALGAQLAGAGLAAAGGLTRLARLPVSVPALVSAATNVPHIRAFVRSRLDPNRAEPLLAAGEAAVSALAGHPTGLLVDAVHRVQRLAEARARGRAWERRAADLFTADEVAGKAADAAADGAAEGSAGGAEGAADAAADGSAGGAAEKPAGEEADEVADGAAGEAHEDDPAVPAGRPVPLPDGPVEAYAARAATAGLAGWAGGLLAARPHLAVAALAAATAKPARMAKESFAARVGRCVAERGILVAEPAALRRLDRVDTVLLDAAVLVTGRWAIDEVVPLTDEADPPGLHAQVLGLLDPADPDLVRERDGWWIAPATGAERSAGQWAAGAKLVTLRHGDEAVAVASLLPELDPYAEALVAAAGGVGDVLIAGESGGLASRLAVTGTVPAGPRLGASVRALQAEGHGVLLVARHGRTALAASDIGIAVVEPGSATRVRRGTGHVFCGSGLGDAVQVLAAVPAARRAATAGTRIAGYEAAVASVIGMASPVRRAGRYALLGSNVAALAGIATGVWHADLVVRMREPRPVDRNPWHAIPVREALARLRSSPRGLAGGEAAHRRPAAGGAEPQPPGLGRAVAEELGNPLTPALAAGAGLAGAVGSTLDAALIAGVVAVNSLVGGVQRLGAERAVRRLAEHTSLPVRLLRGGEQVTTGAEELVPGDVVELRAGDAVPADCRVVEAVGLEVDEASLTGESLPVAKTAAPSTARVPADRTSMLYEGTAVAAGHGLAAVVATGPDTEARRAEQSAERPPTGGVQSRLRELTGSALPLSAGAGALLLATNLLRGLPMSQALTPAISLAVAAVPEGLPSVATIGQLASARRLSRRGVLVRNPATLEALGRVQALCFDKTGTLTEGRLRLRLVSDGTDEATPAELTGRLRHVLAAALRATPAHQTGREPGSAVPQTAGPAPLAHPTDRAVAAGGKESGLDVHDGLPGWERIDELPFEPRRGLHAALGACGDGRRVLSVKGAPEVVIRQCTRRLVGEQTRPLDDAARAKLMQTAEGLAGRGYRVLAVAEGPVPAAYQLTEDNLDGLRFVGFVALADRVRPAAAEAVSKLRGAGVRVVMITGDHPQTAETVAAELGVLDDGLVLSGADLDRMADEQLTQVLPRVTVFARTAPAQKVRVVRLLRKAGQTVAVTGDGANDAPAIRAAHVGIALGSRATPAARDAADVVVADDRIETVVSAVVEGRVLWSSVRDALAVLLGGNLGEVAFTVAAGLLGGTGLNPRQLLLVNMLTDVVPALVLAARRPGGSTPEALLAEGPDASLGPALRRDIQVRAITTASAAGAGWLFARFTGTPSRASTVALVSTVSAQLGQTLVAGRFDPRVGAACLASLLLLAAAVQTPGLSQLLGSRPIGPVGWAIALGTAAASTGTAWWIERP